MKKPGIIITGATGFLGNRLVKKLHKDYRIFAIALRSPRDVSAPEGHELQWFQVHIGNMDRLLAVFNHIREMGGAEILLHLAAYYDFTGVDHPEYEQTNVIGTRNVLELSVPLKLQRFIFTSSVAACPFPEPGKTVTEDTPPLAPVPYAQSKRKGEEMMHHIKDRIPSCILRLAAIFSDWSEYQPLDVLLRTWCSNRWDARILAGRGKTAIPYLHAKDLLSFFLSVIKRSNTLNPMEILQASPDGSTTHLELYRETTRNFFKSTRFPIHVPKSLARSGLLLREKMGQRTGNMPFERSWMADYIDLRLDIDASRTRNRMDWMPQKSLHILKRIPYMVQNMQNHPDEWERRNKARRQFDRTN